MSRRHLVGPLGGLIASSDGLGRAQADSRPEVNCACGCNDDCCRTSCSHWLTYLVESSGTIVYTNEGDVVSTESYTSAVRGRLRGYRCDGDDEITGEYVFDYYQVQSNGGPWVDDITNAPGILWRTAADFGSYPEDGWYYDYEGTPITSGECLEGVYTEDNEPGDPEFAYVDDDDVSIYRHTEGGSTTTTFTHSDCIADDYDSNGVFIAGSDYCDQACHSCNHCPHGPTTVVLTLTVDGTPIYISLGRAGGTDPDQQCVFYNYVLGTTFYLFPEITYNFSGDRNGFRYRLNGSGAININYILGCSGSNYDFQMLGEYGQTSPPTAYESAHTLTAVVS